MNTGSGKTLVALLILQSCLNEGVGPALYVVPDKFLVEQVKTQADALGIKVTDTENDLDYQRKKADPCYRNTETGKWKKYIWFKRRK